jgi:hypothetical protein
MLIGPREAASMQIKFRELECIEDMTEAPHCPQIQSAIALISSLIYHVEVTNDKPRAIASSPGLT